MKIALVSRGLVRSAGGDPVQWCWDNHAILLDHLVGHEIDTYFCSWNSPEAAKFATVFDYAMLLQEPSHEECFRRLPIQPIWFRDPGHYCHNTPNLYKFFHQSRMIMHLVRNVHKAYEPKNSYDYIIFTRPDMRIRIDDITPWFTQDYCVPGMSYVNFNDHLNISPAEKMLAVWGYSDQNLKEMVEQSRDTEEVVRKLVEQWTPHYSMDNISEYFIRGFDVVSYYRAGQYDVLKRQLGVV